MILGLHDSISMRCINIQVTAFNSHYFPFRFAIGRINAEMYAEMSEELYGNLEVA